MSSKIGKISFDPKGKYRPFPSVDLPERSWPDQKITKAPTWCSVDLRDGNQALINPMTADQKKELFLLLTTIGFKQIEIGFPSAAQVEFDFTRTLIEKDLIPDDVIPQVLCQAREHLIKRTFESIQGAKQAIFHLYNSTSTAQRKIVFKLDRAEILKMAVDATKLVKQYAADCDTEIFFEYSPESFTATELDFAKDVCEAVMDAWQPSADQKMILNLPATVELHTPNIHADQIEWFSRNVSGRENYFLSLHTHNDRGTGTAATELGLLAGADRVEGTLFGNGERTGNVDIITLALNLYTQGVDPELKLDNLLELRDIAERLTEIPTNPRHPYSGDLVFTAFSGSHQDAIKKGMDLHKKKSKDDQIWEVPYIPIDPTDIGRTYEAIIRINSQSGKGGVAYVLEHEYGYRLPRPMHPEVSQAVQKVSDLSGKEVSADAVRDEFIKQFVNLEQPCKYVDFSYQAAQEEDQVDCTLTFEMKGETVTCTGTGNGPINACKHAIEEKLQLDFVLTDYLEHALTTGSNAEAIAYIQIENSQGEQFYGAGTDFNTNRASIKALLCAINRTFS